MRHFFNIFTLLLGCFILMSCTSIADDEALLGNLTEEEVTVVKDRLVAHRGAHNGTGCSQNSYEAVSYALQKGAKHVEIDIRETKDHRIILNHDATHADLDIATSTYAELAAQPLPKGETIPLLADILSLLKAYPESDLFLEIKTGNTDLIDSLINDYEVKDQIIIISFNNKKCEEMIDKGYRVMPLTSTEDLAALAARGYYGIDFHYSYFDQAPEKIQEAHDLGLLVNIWTVDNPVRISSFLTSEADLITTNYPYYNK